MKSKNNYIKKKVWPLLVSISSASIMLLAFFIPSVQDQWDRYQSRKIIQQYVEMGDDFFREENYSMAQKAFTRAFELSNEQRLDIEIKRLHSKISESYVDLGYGIQPSDSLIEADFQYLLHMLKDDAHQAERSEILTTYSLYLAHQKRIPEALKAINEAIALNPKNPFAFIGLGNIMLENGKTQDAQRAYEKALANDPGNFDGYYYLGHLFLTEHKVVEAKNAFQKALAIDSTDVNVKQEIDSVLLLKE